MAQMSSAVSSSLPYSREKKIRNKLKHARTPGTTNTQYLSCLLVSSATAERELVYILRCLLREKLVSFINIRI